MINLNERIFRGILSLALVGLATGYGMTELDKLLESKQIQQATQQAIELVKQPEKMFNSNSKQTQQQQQQQITADKLITEPIKYELPKKLVWKDLCKYYTILEKCKEVEKNE